MAKNREPVMPVETESESSEEEEETDASSNEVESDPETAFTPSSSSAVKNPQPSQPLPPDSSDEEDSESHSDSDPEPSKLQQPKPITTVPPLTPTKRPAEGKKSEGKDGKKPKNITEKKFAEANKNAYSVSDSSKKVLFQRLWSDDDEIVILKGMIEYEAMNSVSPSANLDAFLDYIKKNLHVDVNKTQLQDKIRRLRKKFENNKGKARNLTKPHEKTTYELSEKVWGGEKGKEVAALNDIENGSAVKRNPSKKGNAAENGGQEAVVEVWNGALEKKVLLGKGVSSCGLTPEEKLMRIGAELFEGEDEIEGSEVWKKLEREAMELSLMRLDVKRAKMKLVLDTME